MVIRKVEEPNPAYFMDAKKVRNWFDESNHEGEKEDDKHLSLNSTLAEIQATAEGAELLENLMKQMQSSVAGGMGQNAQVPKAMMEMIARQPLKKLLAQSGMDVEGEQAKMLATALARIPKK